MSIFRDVAIVLLAAFLMVFAVLRLQNPTTLGIVLGAALTMLGVPPALRVHSNGKNGKEDS